MIGNCGCFQDLVAVQVGDGHLRCRDQVQPIRRGVVHLAFLVRQLAGGEGAFRVHHVRWNDLPVARFDRLVQEESDQGALQLGPLSAIDRKARAGHLHTEVHVQDAVFLAKFPMRFGIRAEFGIAPSCITVTFSSGVRPAGTLEWGAFGMVQRWSCSAFSAASKLLLQGGGPPLQFNGRGTWRFRPRPSCRLSSGRRWCGSASSVRPTGHPGLAWVFRRTSSSIARGIQQGFRIDVAFGQALFGLFTVLSQVDSTPAWTTGLRWCAKVAAVGNWASKYEKAPSPCWRRGFQCRVGRLLTAVQFILPSLQFVPLPSGSEFGLLGPCARVVGGECGACFGEDLLAGAPRKSWRGQRRC